MWEYKMYGVIIRKKEGNQLEKYVFLLENIIFKELFVNLKVEFFRAVMVCVFSCFEIKV